MEPLLITVTLFFIFFTALILHLRRNRGKIEPTGLPIIKPFLFFGSPPFLLNKIHFHKWYENKFAEFGTKTFARYEGVHPVIVTIDPEIIKEVTVKQFDNFTDVFDVEYTPEQTSLDLARGESWRVLRKMMTPAFKAAKLKHMINQIEQVADDTLDYLDSKVEGANQLDLKPYLFGFTLDSIAKVAFGMQTKAHRGESKDFSYLAYDLFQGFYCKSTFEALFFNITYLFPGFASLMGLWPESAIKIAKITHDLMLDRDERNVQVGDFVDQLREFKKVPHDPPINDKMIEAQGMLFMSAGYETSANALGALMYFIACHQDVQERIYDEIKELSDDEINYESIHDLHYLEACLMETLRLNPPVIEHDRTCVKDCIVNGLPIRKGVRIQMPNYSAHYNADFFPDPNQFKPERFLKDNACQEVIPYTWRPFGSGNRACIGQRYAMMKMKLFMAKFLTRFKVESTAESKLDHFKGNIFLLATPNTIVKIEKRQ